MKATVNLEKLVNWLIAMLQLEDRFKNITTVEWKGLRVALGKAGDKAKISEWVPLSYDSLDNILERITERNYIQVLLTKLPLQLVIESDSESKRKQERIKREIPKIIRDTFNAKPIIVFTSNRSYHFHLFLDEPARSLREYKQIAEALTGVIEGLLQVKIDWNVAGSFNTTYRVPYSLHPKTLKEVEVVNLRNVDFNAILEFIEQNKISKASLLKMANVSVENNKRVKIRRGKGKGKIYPCIYESVINTKFNDGLSRLVGLLFALAKRFGKSKEEFLKDMERFAKTNSERYNRIMSKARSYYNHYEEYNYSPTYFIRILLEDISEEDKKKIEKILQSCGFKFL